MNLNVSASWKNICDAEFEKDYFKQLKIFLNAEACAGNVMFPAQDNIFNALNLCPIENVRVVIIGQDPYHDVGQAHGLCFSVLNPTPVPPSLRNIYKEIESDLGQKSQTSGDLTFWAQQGVLLLNATLTVRAHEAKSHFGRGWEIFTDAIIKTVAARNKNVVYMLWGAPAQKKAAFVSHQDNLILKSAHPSPLSSYRGFFGCKHFSSANEYLKSHNKSPIIW